MALLDGLTSGRKVVNRVTSFGFKEVGGKERVLQLQGRGLPFRPLILTVQQRNDNTWLPGYAQSSLTLLGALEAPTSINGRWSDKYISSSSFAADGLGPLSRAFAAADAAISAAPAALGIGAARDSSPNEIVPITFNGMRVETVREASQIIDTWVRSGQLLQVAWDEDAFYGIIGEFTKRWMTAHDLEWEIHFEWTGRAEPTIPVVVAEELSMSSTASLFQSLVDALDLEALPPTFPMTNDAFREIDQGIKRIASTTQALSDTVANVARLATAPLSAIRQIVALTQTIRGQAAELINTLTSLVPGGQWHNPASYTPSISINTGNNPASTLPIGGLSFGQRTTAMAYQRSVIGRAKAIERAAVQQNQTYSTRLDRDLEGKYAAREGEDLRDVSQLFYGTPHEWHRIMIFNELKTPKLSNNIQLLIPKAVVGELC